MNPIARPEADNRTGFGNLPSATFSRILAFLEPDLVLGRGHAKDAAGEGSFHQYAPRFFHLTYASPAAPKYLDLERTYWSVKI